uniref:UDP-galactose transporter n=1 Tax=Rhabditophanes sp. KR3021 TaxID=114890 RepID=A0AC35TJ30_9BILA
MTNYGSCLVSMKSLTLIFFVFHSTLSVCLLRYVRFRDVKVMYAAPAALFVGELVKIGLSVIFLSWESKSVKKALKLIYVGTVIEWRECLKASVASACYVFQNLLYYYSISYLDATLLLVTQQIKILTTALFAVLLLKKRLSLVQWSSMVVLIFGIILVQWKVEKKAAGVVENNTTTASSVEGTTVFLSTTTPYYPLPNPLNLSPGIIGLIMVLIASILSGFTGIYLEKMFKNSTLSLWTRNFQLAVFSIPLLLCLAMITDYDQITNGGLFNGFDTWVFAVSFVFGVHGLIVALLLKHASSILKCFASGFVIAMTSIVSIFLFNKWPSYLFVIGTLIILVAVFLYSNFPYKQKTIVLGKIRPV